MDPDFFGEFDRYVERNGIAPDELPQAMERFLREHGEAPDARLAGRVGPDGEIEPVESESQGNGG